jgi:hypothetical protein
MKFDKTAIKEYYGGLPTWAKGVVVVGGLFIVYAVGKKVIGIAFPSASKVRNQQLAKDITQEISRLRKTKTQTFNDSQYKVFANSIYEGMRYCVGDDYGGVEDTMKKMMNDLDVALLIQAYGFRRRACFGIDTGGTDDLFTSVKAELGVTNINNNWARKGINYRL